jgi:hypothetical protein
VALLSGDKTVEEIAKNLVILRFNLIFNPPALPVGFGFKLRFRFPVS